MTDVMKDLVAKLEVARSALALDPTNVGLKGNVTKAENNLSTQAGVEALAATQPTTPPVAALPAPAQVPTPGRMGRFVDWTASQLGKPPAAIASALAVVVYGVVVLGALYGAVHVASYAWASLPSFASKSTPVAQSAGMFCGAKSLNAPVKALGTSGGTEAEVSCKADFYYMVPAGEARSGKVSRIETLVVLHTAGLTDPTHSRGVGAWLWSWVSSFGAQEASMNAVRSLEAAAHKVAVSEEMRAEVRRVLTKSIEEEYGVKDVRLPVEFEAPRVEKK